MKNEEERDRLAAWEDRWREGRIQFHESIINKTLKENYERLTNGRRGLKFFVPLCGKTVCMKWLLDQGQYVIGVEAVEAACRQFFEEQSIKYSITDIDSIAGGKLFTSHNGSCKIYHCDLFSVTRDILGPMDITWDRGSLVAIDEEDRPQYLKLMQEVMVPESSLLLEVVEYDHSKRPTKGPPHSLDLSKLTELYGDWCHVEQLPGMIEEIDDKPNYKKWGIDSFLVRQYLMTVK